MATYTINYLTGDTETVQADGLVRDDDEYRAYNETDARNSVTVAWIPACNVRSVLRAEDEKRQYPYEDGDIIVLGPETFTDHTHEAISHKGIGYTRRPGPNLFLGGKALHGEVTG